MAVIRQCHVIAGAVRRAWKRYDPVSRPRHDVLRRGPRLAYTSPDERQRSPSQLIQFAAAEVAAATASSARESAAAVADVAESDGATGDRHRGTAEPAVRRIRRSLHLLIYSFVRYLFQHYYPRVRRKTQNAKLYRVRKKWNQQCFRHNFNKHKSIVVTCHGHNTQFLLCPWPLRWCVI